MWKKSIKLSDKVKIYTRFTEMKSCKILDAYLAEDENSHKQSATVSANLEEICDSLRNLDFCVLHQWE